MQLFGVLSSPGQELLSIGPFVIRWYGLLIAIAVLIGLKLSTKLANLRGVNNKLINDLLPILVLCSIIGARIYYVAFEWKHYVGVNFWGKIKLINFEIPIPRALEIWGGGIAIHGALIAGIFSVFIFCRLKKESFLNILDILLPSVALGQAIGRWGNFFNNEAFGLPTNLPWKLFIPYYLRPNEFANDKFFHPTFLYESIWNVLVFACLITLFFISYKTSKKLINGTISFIYLILYSFGRLFIEGLRTDPLCLGGLPPFCEGGFRMAQIISVVLICIGFIGLSKLYKEKRNPIVLIKTYKRNIK
tara:strand:+ start:111 stop:1022 length:912 start_codon:yes stop_codon:yes gene_type:complete